MKEDYFTCGQELGCARYIEGEKQKKHLTADACVGMMKRDAETDRYIPVCKEDNQPGCAVSRGYNLMERIAMQQGGRNL